MGRAKATLEAEARERVIQRAAQQGMPASMSAGNTTGDNFKNHIDNFLDQLEANGKLDELAKAIVGDSKKLSADIDAYIRSYEEMEAGQGADGDEAGGKGGGKSAGKGSSGAFDMSFMKGSKEFS